MKAILPIRILIIFLILLAISAIFAWSGFDGVAWLKHIRNFAAIFLSGYAISSLFTQKLQRAPSRAEHRIITSLILFLLFDPIFPWWAFLVLGASTEALQRLIRTQSGPIFNPAALTAFVFGIAGYYPAWWGMSFPPSIPIVPGGISVALLLTVPFAGYVAYRYRKLPIVFSLIAVFILTNLIIFGTIPLLFLVEGAFVFFLLVMAIEPKTSPVTVKDQSIYGAIAGLGIPLGMYLGAADTLLLSLLLANLYTARNFLLRRI
jgi:Na+-translocating ferredoxin:NAD+ oxidoreductase RnfD subunit